MLPLTKISLSRGLMAWPWPSPIICRHSQVLGCVRHWDGARGSWPSGGAASPTPRLPTPILDRGPLRRGVGRGAQALGRFSGRTQGGLPGPGQGSRLKVPAFPTPCKPAPEASGQNNEEPVPAGPSCSALRAQSTPDGTHGRPYRLHGWQLLSAGVLDTHCLVSSSLKWRQEPPSL